MKKENGIIKSINEIVTVRLVSRTLDDINAQYGGRLKS